MRLDVNSFMMYPTQSRMIFGLIKIGGIFNFEMGHHNDKGEKRLSKS